MFYSRNIRISKLFSVLFGIVLFFSPAIYSSPAKSSSSVWNGNLSAPVRNPALSENSLAAFVNRQRNEHGLAALRNTPALQKAAQSKAEDMAEKEYFSHLSPDGRTPWYWIKKSSYEYSSAGENLAAKFTNPEILVSRWMASRTHRENILNRNFEDFGIGIAEGNYEGRKTLYVVTMFGQAQKPAPGLATIR